MELSLVDIAIILSPLLSFLAMVYTWFKTRVKEANFLVFDFHITNIKSAEREGEKLALITSTSTILNKGDRVGFVRFKRAVLKGHLKGSEDKIAFELKQPEHTEPRIFSLDSGIATSAGFNFETEKLAMKNGWEKAKLTVEGSYITHKGKTKEFNLEFIGSSEKKKMWESPKKRKEKTIVII